MPNLSQPLYVTTYGGHLRIEKRRVLIEHNGQTLHSAPIFHVSEVVLLGSATLTTPAIKLLLGEGIDVVFLKSDGTYLGRLKGPASPHVALRRRQYQHLDHPPFGLKLAQQIVVAKLEHQRALLQRHSRQNASPMVATAIETLASQRLQTQQATSLAALNGIEGSAAAAYFGGLRQLIGAEWRFDRRARRPPPDPVNVMLSLGYTLLSHAARGAIETTGLDPYVGYLHQPDYNRPSLALDLVEEFRPAVDGVVLWCCHTGQITPADFTPGPAERPVIMGDAAKKRFIAAYEARLAETRRHPLLNQELSLRQCLLAQARQIAQAVSSGNPNYVPLGFR